MYLFISVETNGVGSFLSQDLVRVALVITDAMFETLSLESFYVQGCNVLSPAVQSVGHTLEQIENGLHARDAKSLIEARVAKVRTCMSEPGVIVAHNSEYVTNILRKLDVQLVDVVCTMKLSTPICCLPPANPSLVSRNGQYKYPQLGELNQFFYGTRDVGSRAEEKAWAVKQCYQAMMQMGE